jgi:hypothetical protein
MKDFYENMKLLLEKIHYKKYNLSICRDLKVMKVISALASFTACLHKVLMLSQ